MEAGHLFDPVSPDQSWLSIPEAAESLGVSTLVVRRWVEQGLLRAEWRDGGSGPQKVALIPREGLRPDTGQPHAGSLPTLVGRRRELHTLKSALESASNGQGSLVLIAGDAGIGKTTLVDAAVATAVASGFRLLSGQCFDAENSPVYGVWRNAFSNLPAALSSPVTPSFFAADAGDVVIENASTLYTGLERFILRVSERAPLLIVLEDIHWADRASLDLLRFVARNSAHQPVSIIATYRDVDLSPETPLYLVLPLLVRESLPTRINLRPLERDEVASLLHARYRLPQPDLERLAAYIWRFAEDNPLFGEELAIHLEHTGVLERAADGWQLGELPEFRVPPLVQQILARRFRRVTEKSIHFLKVASVIGIDVPLDLWQEVSRASQDELAACIDEALASQLIVEDPQRDAIRFRHALIREALYDDLQIIRRREQHLRTAEALVGKSDPDANLVAHHFQLANDDRSIDWLIKAGRHAALSFAFQPACEKFTLAWQLLERQPERQDARAWLACELAAAYRYTDTEQALIWANRAVEEATGLDDPALSVVIPWIRSHVRGFLGEDSLSELYQAVAALERLSHADTERIQATSLAFIVSRGLLCQRIAFCARYADARRVGEEFLALAIPPMTAREQHDHGTAHIGLGLAYANLGMPDEARASFAAAREHLQQASHHFLTGTANSHEYRHVIEAYFPDRVDLRRQLIESADAEYRRSVVAVTSANQQHKRIFGALILDGRWDEARTAAESLVTSRYLRVESAEVLAELDWLQGHHERAWSWIDASIPEGSSVEPATTHYHEVLTFQRVVAELALHHDQLDLALAWIKALRRWLAWGDSVLGRYVPDMLLAQYEAKRGDLDAALEHARNAVRAAQTPRQPLGLLRAERLAGTLADSAGLHDQSARHLGLALDLAHAIQSPYDTALAEIAYARHLLSQKDKDGTSRLMAASRGVLERLGAGPALASLAELEGRLQAAEAVEPPAFGLSARELEVLRLVAQGLTDAEIGEQLFISRRTVSGHLCSIFAKCGVTSRAAATALAYEHAIIAAGR